MKYFLVLVLFLVGCGEDSKPVGVGPVAFPHKDEAPVAAPVVAAEPTPPAEPEKTDAQKEAENEAEWTTAKAGLAKLSHEDIVDMKLEEMEQRVHAHYAAKKLTDKEIEVLGWEE